MDEINGNGGDVELAEAGPGDVAALLRARTKDTDGRELGEWTEETRPTVTEVEQKIEIARALVGLNAGAIPDPCREGAETAVALLAAMLVEQSYFPEQVADNRSPYQMLERLYAQASAGLAECVNAHGYGDAFELHVGARPVCWPIDWWQRNLEVAP
jgi:hypothetical protein